MIFHSYVTLPEANTQMHDSQDRPLEVSDPQFLGLDEFMAGTTSLVMTNRKSHGREAMAHLLMPIEIDGLPII